MVAERRHHPLVSRVSARIQAVAPRRFHRDLAHSDDANHPERTAILPFVQGFCLEVGCGFRKTDESVVGVDLVRRGRLGRVGNVKGRVSQADVAADGSRLPFSDDAFDSLIARHNLEHYVDTAGVLLEWRRVLRPGGTLAVILPDEARYPGRTLDLDPTHFHGYSEEALARLVELVGGFRDITTGPVIDGWSFLLSAVREAVREEGREASSERATP